MGNLLRAADVTVYSTVVVCQCGARFAATGRPAALRAAATHLDRAHPGAWPEANKARQQARRCEEARR